MQNFQVSFFYMNKKLQGDFQIYISVRLNSFEKHFIVLPVFSARHRTVCHAMLCTYYIRP